MAIVMLPEPPPSPLRGFDASSTLVLLDGRRLAPYPVAGGATGGVTFVDLNSIPKAALESIEILKDSASSIYGADAVAGVGKYQVPPRLSRSGSHDFLWKHFGQRLGRIYRFRDLRRRR